ncbi:hypothetical protein ACFCZV_30645 [Streptomyces hydrogenans]|uniref:hypothetical protein n=1 Tax=Streptomyces hydrogenans TaxID=1873719 RepID=UPI0035D8734F
MKYETAASVLDSLSLSRHELPATGDSSPQGEVIWVTGDETTAMQWVHEDLLDVSYIAVRGAGAAEWAERIGQVVPLDGPELIRGRIVSERDTDSLIDGLFRAAVVACHGFDETVFSLLRWASYDPDPLIRRSALLGVSIVRWTEFSTLLDDVATNDPEGDIREQAARVGSLLDG